MAGSAITKAVILARGLGKRMRQRDDAAELDAAQSAAADMGVKAMVPVGRPFLDYSLSALADAGFERACLVIGPEHSAVRDYYAEQCVPRRIHVEFAVQAEALGTANALVAAEKFCGADEFLVINGDNLYPLEALEKVQQLGEPGTVLFDAESLVTKGNIPEERVKAFATCVVDGEGYLADIVEKPGGQAIDGTDLISMNCWRFSAEIFAPCREVAMSARREYELPLAVKLAIQRGTKLKVTVSHDRVLDLSRRSDVAIVTERLKNVRVEP